MFEFQQVIQLTRLSFMTLPHTLHISLLTTCLKGKLKK